MPNDKHTRCLAKARAKIYAQRAVLANALARFTTLAVKLDLDDNLVVITFQEWHKQRITNDIDKQIIFWNKQIRTHSKMKRD